MGSVKILVVIYEAENRRVYDPMARFKKITCCSSFTAEKKESSIDMRPLSLDHRIFGPFEGQVEKPLSILIIIGKRRSTLFIMMRKKLLDNRWFFIKACAARIYDIMQKKPVSDESKITWLWDLSANFVLNDDTSSGHFWSLSSLKDFFMWPVF